MTLNHFWPAPVTFQTSSLNCHRFHDQNDISYNSNTSSLIALQKNTAEAINLSWLCGMPNFSVGGMACFLPVTAVEFGSRGVYC